MTNLELNSKTVHARAGRDHPPTIRAGKASVFFSYNAIKKLNLTDDDRISFHFREGVLRMFFDPQKGFELKKMRKEGQAHIYVINNTELCENLRRLCGEKMLVGDFKDGAYILNRIKR